MELISTFLTQVLLPYMYMANFPIPAFTFPCWNLFYKSSDDDESPQNQGAKVANLFLPIYELSTEYHFYYAADYSQTSAIGLFLFYSNSSIFIQLQNCYQGFLWTHTSCFCDRFPRPKDIHLKSVLPFFLFPIFKAVSYFVTTVMSSLFVHKQC